MVSKEDVLKQMVKQWHEDEIVEEEFTTDEMWEILIEAEIDVPRDYVYTKLKKLCSVGVLSMRRARRPGQTGAMVNAYRPAEGKSWEDVLQYIKSK